jgi:hypothetical protein
VRNGLGTTLAEVENLPRFAINGRKTNIAISRTSLQARTGAIMTLRGIFMAEIACRGLWQNVSGQKTQYDRSILYTLKVEARKRR